MRPPQRERDEHYSNEEVEENGEEGAMKHGGEGGEDEMVEMEGGEDQMEEEMIPEEEGEGEGE